MVGKMVGMDCTASMTAAWLRWFHRDSVHPKRTLAHQRGQSLLDELCSFLGHFDFVRKALDVVLGDLAPDVRDCEVVQLAGVRLEELDLVVDEADKLHERTTWRHTKDPDEKG
jgi:hypothetical protein